MPPNTVGDKLTIDTVSLATSIGFTGKTCWAAQCQFVIMKYSAKNQAKPRTDDKIMQSACAFCPRYGQPGCASLTDSNHKPLAALTKAAVQACTTRVSGH